MQMITLENLAHQTLQPTGSTTKKFIDHKKIYVRHDMIIHTHKMKAGNDIIQIPIKYVLQTIKYKINNL